MYVTIYIYICVYIYICIYKCVCMCIYICVCVCVCLYVVDICNHCIVTIPHLIKSCDQNKKIKMLVYIFIFIPTPPQAEI